jgi:hypothetical protein
MAFARGTGDLTPVYRGFFCFAPGQLQEPRQRRTEAFCRNMAYRHPPEVKDIGEGRTQYGHWGAQSLNR